MNKFTNFPAIGLLLLCVLSASTLYAQKEPQGQNELRKKILDNERVQSVIIDEERQAPSMIILNKEKKSYSRSETAGAINSFLSVRNNLDVLQQDKQNKLPGGHEILE